MNTKYEQIVNIEKIGEHGAINLNEILELAQNENIKKSSADTIRRLLLCIDVQKDFIEGGPMGVPNSIKDVENITKFIYKNMDEITNIMCSLDTHTPGQIFHPAWWVDENGNTPNAYTIITYEDVQNRKWIPVLDDTEDSIEYLKQLNYLGKSNLCIWPYHCISGTEGATIENELAKIIYFHSVARSCTNPMIFKGTDPKSEMYGIIKPEYSKDNFINMEVLNTIKQYDEVYVVGEASSHCVLESVKQIAEYFSEKPEILNRITILTDCTSSITGYEENTTKEFKELAKVGIKFKKSTEVVLN